MRVYFTACAIAVFVGLAGVVFNVFSTLFNRNWMCVVGLSLTAAAVSIWLYGHWMLRFSF